MASPILTGPHTPPLEWATTDPDWYRPGQNLTIDKTTGRVCGEVQPPPAAGVFIGAGPNNGKPIPATYPDETFADFHCGSETFLDPDGQPVEAAVGTVALEGGHSAMVGASNVIEATDWLQRKGPWTERKNDLVAYGKISRQQSGPRAGALIFRGSVYPWTTVEDAMAVNTTTVSGENWPHPDHGGAYQFMGPARVRQTSFKYDHPTALAAELGLEAGGPLLVIEASTFAEPEPVSSLQAEIDPTDLAALAAELQALREQMDAQDRNAASILAHIMDEEDLSEGQWREDIGNRLTDVAERLKALEERLDRGEDQRVEVETQGAGPAVNIVGG